MKNPTKSHAAASPATHPTQPSPRSFEAFEHTRAEREAVAREELALMNVDITDATTTVYGALPSIIELRPKLAKLEGFRIAAVDRLEDYALSAELANARYTIATPAPDGIEKLVPEATATRDRLLAIARGLAAWNVFDAQAVAAITPAAGYRAPGDQLVTLAQLFRAGRDAIRGRSPVTDDDVAHAALVGEQLLATVGLRDHVATEPTDAARSPCSTARTTRSAAASRTCAGARATSRPSRRHCTATATRRTRSPRRAPTRRSMRRPRRRTRPRPRLRRCRRGRTEARSRSERDGGRVSNAPRRADAQDTRGARSCGDLGRVNAHRSSG